MKVHRSQQQAASGACSVCVHLPNACNALCSQVLLTKEDEFQQLL
jgi:hypothetical protein